MKNELMKMVLISTVIISIAQSQSIWNQRSDKLMLRVEYLNPQVAQNRIRYENSTNIVIVSGRVPWGEKVRFNVEVPMISSSYSSPYLTESNNAVGNIFLGLEFGSIQSPISIELGARPLLKQEIEITGIGILGDYERSESYIPELTSYFVALNIHSIAAQGFVYRIRIAPMFWAPEKGDGSTIVDYGAKIGFEHKALSVYTGITGRWNTDQNQGKSTFHHLAIDLGIHVGNVRPALFYRIPLDEELSKIITQTFGASISVEL